MSLTVLNPTYDVEAQPLRLAPPVASLEGALVGVVDNGKVNADRLFELVGTLLRERYGVRELLRRRKHDFSRPAPAALLAELSACDAVLTGIGD